MYLSSLCKKNNHEFLDLSSGPKTSHILINYKTPLLISMYYVYLNNICHFIFQLSSNGGSDKQHLDSSSDSEMDTPNMMLNNTTNHSLHHHSLSHVQSATTPQQHQLPPSSSSQDRASSQHTMQLSLNNSNSIQSGSGTIGGSLLVSTSTSNSLNNNNNNSTGINSSSGSGMMAHMSSGGSSKHLAQMPPLSAVAYSHLHGVIGSMPIYDIGDYQHL